MTNEELVLRIKNGERQYITELWANVEKLVYQQTFKYYTVTSERLNKLGITYDDLLQESYFGFLKAVEAYKDNSEYKFNTALGFYLKSIFAKNAGYRSTGDSKRAKLLLSSANLQDVLADRSGDSVTYEDYLPDERAEQELNSIIGDDEQTNIHDDLQEAIADLPDTQSELIIENYYNNSSLRKIAERWRVSVGYLSKLRQDALANLRQDKRLEKYKHFRRKKQELLEKYETGFGFSKFKAKRMSSQEAYIIKLEQLEKEYGIT